jgi:hypothetical protein
MTLKSNDAEEARRLAQFIDQQNWEDPQSLLTALILIASGTTIHIGLSVKQAQDIISEAVGEIYGQMESMMTTKGMVMQ